MQIIAVKVFSLTSSSSLTLIGALYNQEVELRAKLLELLTLSFLLKVLMSSLPYSITISLLNVTMKVMMMSLNYQRIPWQLCSSFIMNRRKEMRCQHLNKTPLI